MKKKSVTKILLSVMVLLVSVAFCACGSNKSTESSETGNSSSEKTTESAADGTQSDAANSDTSCFTVGLSQEISSLDPHEDTDAGTRSVLFNVFEGLVKPTTDGDVTPAVASDYTISDDAKTYTFTLRDGITFQDGNPVTVEDIKYSLERSAEMDGESSALSAISAINIVDDKTIELTLSEANSEFIYNLSVAILSVQVLSRSRTLQKVSILRWRDMMVTGTKNLTASSMPSSNSLQMLSPLLWNFRAVLLICFSI